MVYWRDSGLAARCRRSPARRPRPGPPAALGRTAPTRWLFHYTLPERDRVGAYDPEHILADMLHAAQQLIANAESDTPRSHQQALDCPGYAKVLESISAAYRQHGTRIYVCYGGRGHVAPVLEAGDFVEPVAEDRLEQTSTFRITALRRDFETGRTGFGIGRDELPVDLPSDDLRWRWDAVSDVLQTHSFLVGTICRASRAEAWRPAVGARLERQPTLPRSSDG